MPIAPTDRRHLIERQLLSALPHEAAQRALALYDNEFAISIGFSLADFCHRLSVILPDFPLPRETRLSLLRELRQLGKAPTAPLPMGAEVAS